MALTIEVIEDGKTKAYTVRDYDELTIADWRALTSVEQKATPKDQEEAEIELLKRHTGISKAKLRRLPTNEFNRLSAAISETMQLAISHRDGEPSYVPPDTITHQGVEYVVPNKFDPLDTTVWERQTVIGQFLDMRDQMKADHEADLLKGTLMALLVEKGQEYGAWTDAKREAMEAFPLHIAFDLCAFFFACSQRYRNVVLRFSQACQGSKQPSTGLVLKPSPTATGNSLPSSALQN